MASWQALEDRVRELASFIWGTECKPKEIAGVKMDGVIELRPNHWILLEITENESLAKLRDDLAKFHTVTNSLSAKRIVSECFFITADEPPESIPKSAEADNVIACSIASFATRFFDFAQYKYARQSLPFGSSFNPFTGDPDKLMYISVKYSADDETRDYDIASVAKLLQIRRNVLLTGDYGTGKSRCVREVFGELAKNYNIQKPLPLAIDLRQTWGLSTADEIVRRHFKRIGLSALGDQAVRYIDKNAFVFLLDGFDELGSQAWSDDPNTLKRVRREALEGVRDLTHRAKGGVLITGRRNYFNGKQEMIEALGLEHSECVMLKCNDEFSNEQLQQFMSVVLPGTPLPKWMPGRPLICQVIAEMEPEHRAQVFAGDGSDVGFWDQFVTMVTKREALIRHSITSEAVRSILQRLARLARLKSGDYGPLAPGEIFAEFRNVLNQEPTAESAQILARLPGLGLVEADSPDRQFVDRFLLDGLRADDVVSIVVNKDHSVCNSPWRHALGELGQRIVGRHITNEGRRGAYLAFASRSGRDGNAVLSLDLVGSILRSATDNSIVDFEGLTITRGQMSVCDLSSARARNLRIKDSIIDQLLLDTDAHPINLTIDECIISELIGVTSPQGLPAWCSDCIVEKYQSLETTSRVRNSNLSHQHQILCVIIRKTFFQKGSGRMEAALLRGLGQIDHGSFRQKILRLLIREKVLFTHEGDEGLIYSPELSQKPRMGQLLGELNQSKDRIWVEVRDM